MLSDGFAPAGAKATSRMEFEVGAQERRDWRTWSEATSW